LVVNLLAAIGACGAAIVALVIATCGRRERRAERFNAVKAQAMLDLLDTELSQGSPAFLVYVTNFGAQAILNVEVDWAQFAPPTTRRPDHPQEHQRRHRMDPTIATRPRPTTHQHFSASRETLARRRRR